jgi:hypothetical protein
VKLTFSTSFHPSMYIAHGRFTGMALRWASIGLRHDELSYDEWFAPMSRGHALIQKYVRVRSHLQGCSQAILPQTVWLYIRHSDKANRRRGSLSKHFFLTA